MSIRFDVINYLEFKLFIDGIGVIDGTISFQKILLKKWHRPVEESLLYLTWAVCIASKKPLGLHYVHSIVTREPFI